MYNTYRAKVLPVVKVIEYKHNSYVADGNGGEKKIPGYVKYRNHVGAECIKTWDQFHEDYE